MLPESQEGKRDRGCGGVLLRVAVVTGVLVEGCVWLLRRDSAHKLKAREAEGELLLG